MTIMNKVFAGLAAAALLATPAIATARDNVYFNFGYSNGYPTRQVYPVQRYYAAPPVVVVPAYPHYYYAPAPTYYSGPRCPPRRHHSLEAHRYRDGWGHRYGTRDPRFVQPYAYRGYPGDQGFVEIDD